MHIPAFGVFKLQYLIVNQSNGLHRSPCELHIYVCSATSVSGSLVKDDVCIPLNADLLNFLNFQWLNILVTDTKLNLIPESSLWTKQQRVHKDCDMHFYQDSDTALQGTQLLWIIMIIVDHHDHHDHKMSMIDILCFKDNFCWKWFSIC
jgi:hypothetical protein